MTKTELLNALNASTCVYCKFYRKRRVDGVFWCAANTNDTRACKEAQKVRRDFIWDEMKKTFEAKNEKI